MLLVRGQQMRVAAWIASSCLALLAIPANAADFIGAESCRACHQAAFDQWKNTPHARAFRTLSAEQQKDGKCLQCHARDAAQGGDPGVTCETCHGAGQYYWPDYVMRDKELARATGLAPASSSDTKACLLCHDGTGSSMKAFDPPAAMKAIDHWSKDKATRSPKSAEACPRPPGSTVASTSRPGETFVGRLLRQVPSPAGKATGAVRVAVATERPVLATTATTAPTTKAD